MPQGRFMYGKGKNPLNYSETMPDLRHTLICCLDHPKQLFPFLFGLWISVNLPDYRAPLCTCMGIHI
jgi:hypothetical protein